MKSGLKISLAANLGLVVALCWVVLRGNGSANRPPAPITPAADAAAVDSQPVAGNSRQAEPKFNWSQLESTNYRTYIANLESIGCPAQTIRDIIVADVDSLYAPRREQVARQPGAEPQLEAINAEEASVLAALLGPPPAAPAQAVADTNTTPVRTPRPGGQNTMFPLAPTMPVVFQEIDPAAMKLTDTQKQVISQLRQQFIDQVGGTNQNPADPAYRARWDQAKKVTDDTLRGLLGNQFYLNYRLQAANALSSK